jgi:hypothetical protein
MTSSLRASLRKAGRWFTQSSGRTYGPLGAAVAIAVLLPLVVSPGHVASPSVSSAIDVADEAAEDADGGPPAGTRADDERARGSVVLAGDRIVQARPEVAEEVETVRPHLIVRPHEPLDAEGLFGLVGLEEINHLASAIEFTATVTSGEASDTLRLFVVDPGAFRPLTPPSTAQAPAVWERLADGELVIRHDVAQHLQLPLGGYVTVDSGEGTEPREVRVGAFASNGSPPFADALVPWSVGGQLAAGAPNVVVVSLVDGADPVEAGRRISERLGGAEVEEIEQPSERRARLVGAGAATFEPFTYVSHGDGMITIEPAWVNSWIVSAEVPIFGRVRCHRTMIPQLRAALAEVQAAGLDRHIDTRDYGGCWVPRHIMFNPSRALSMHAWGLAIDFNVSTNQYGAEPQMHPGIVEIFERWGFRWGGDWSTPDGMHFELRAVVSP